MTIGIHNSTLAVFFILLQPLLLAHCSGGSSTTKQIAEIVSSYDCDYIRKDKDGKIYCYTCRDSLRFGATRFDEYGKIIEQDVIVSYNDTVLIEHNYGMCGDKKRYPCFYILSYNSQEVVSIKWEHQDNEYNIVGKPLFFTGWNYQRDSKYKLSTFTYFVPKPYLFDSTVIVTNVLLNGGELYQDTSSTLQEFYIWQFADSIVWAKVNVTYFFRGRTYFYSIHSEEKSDFIRTVYREYYLRPIDLCERLKNSHRSE